ncbi:MAG: hydroxymethylpyrimidine/phosphomethylpyrimidine kinase [Rhodothermaceae bacterium]
MYSNQMFLLSVAGFDPSGGAGILADIRTFEHHKQYGLGVITANTIQNDSEFSAVDWIETKRVIDQIDILLKKYSVNFVKIGLVKDFNSLDEIISRLTFYNSEVKIIWDPVIKATAGETFHNQIDYKLLSKILNQIYVLTPNLDEVKILFPENYLDDAELNDIINRYDFNLLLKGGHSNEKKIVDKLFTQSGIEIFEGEKFPGYSKHGTGCVFSSALTASLANGNSLAESCSNAKKYVEKFILSNKTNLGSHF